MGIVQAIVNVPQGLPGEMRLASAGSLRTLGALPLLAVSKGAGWFP